MKVTMKWTDRLLLGLYACLGIAATVLITVAMCTGMEIAVMGYHLRLGDGVKPMVALAILAAALLAWSVRLIVLALRHDPKIDKSSVSVQNTENGAVRISVQAMDTLVKQAIGEADGVEQIKTSVINHEDSISVNIDMTLRSDVHIPNVTMLMQRSIKNFIEEFSGIAVRDVTVLVSNIMEVTPPQLSAIEAEPPKAVQAPQEEEEQIDVEAEEPQAQAEPEMAGDEAPVEQEPLEAQPDFEAGAPLTDEAEEDGAFQAGQPEGEQPTWEEGPWQQDEAGQEVAPEEVQEQPQPEGDTRDGEDEEFNEKNIW